MGGEWKQENILHSGRRNKTQTYLSSAVFSESNLTNLKLCTSPSSLSLLVVLYSLLSNARHKSQRLRNLQLEVPEKIGTIASMHNEKRTVRTLRALNKKLKTYNRNISRKRRKGPKLS